MASWIIMGGMVFHGWYVLYLTIILICDPVIGVFGHMSSWTHTRNTTSLLSIRSHFPVPEHIPNPWWRHQMETFSVLLAFCAENSLVTSEFPAQRPVTRSFDIFIHLRLNKRLGKQSWGWWFETPSCSLWSHSNGHQLIPGDNACNIIWRSCRCLNARQT